MFLVPIFQSPDENAHADYALALYSVGHPYTVAHPRCAKDVTAQVPYLARVSKYYGVRFLEDDRVPRGYGTPAFFHNVDAGAPVGRSDVPAAGSKIPCVMFVYPAGYYVVVAAVMTLARAISNGSIMATFFAARSFGIVCLGLTLPLAYQMLRANGVAPRTSTIATAAIGVFPMTSWVSAYVQPDSLTFIGVTLVLVLALRWKRQPFNDAKSLLLAATISGLFFVKQQYAGVLYISCAVLVVSYLGASHIPRLRRAVCTAFILIAPLVALWVSTFATPAGILQVPASIAPSAYVRPAIGPFGSVVEVAAYAAIALRDAYFSGLSFHRFWNSFGWTDISYFSSKFVTFGVETCLGVISIGFMILFLARQLRVLRRCLKVAVSNSVFRATRMLCRDVVLNTYVLWTALLIAVFAVSRGTWSLQGRYWLPVMVPMLIILLCRVPRLLPHHSRARASLIVASSLLLYATISAPFAILAANARYYRATSAPDRVAVTGIDGARILGASSSPLPHIATHRGNDTVISGFAFRATDGSPVERVEIRVDGSRLNTRYGFVVPSGYAPLPVGFRSVVPKNVFAFGAHHVSVVVYADAMHFDRWLNQITLDVSR